MEGIKKNDRGLCFRCDYRADFLETGRTPRFECGVIESAVCGCYMFLPVKPIVIKKRDGDPRPITLDYFSGRVERVNIPNLSIQHKIIDNGMIVYWEPKIEPND